MLAICSNVSRRAGFISLPVLALNAMLARLEDSFARLSQFSADLQSLRDARQQQLKARLKSSADLDDFSSLFAPARRDTFEQMAGTDLAQREIAAIYRCDLSLG